MEHFVFVHLLNDYSGSPRVLRQVIESTSLKGKKITVLSNGGNGFLSDIKGVNYDFFSYHHASNKGITLFRFLWANCLIFFKLLFLCNRKTVVYVNTLLPFGAMLYAKLFRLTCIVHVHEVSIRPKVLYSLLRFIALVCSSQLVFVSKFVRESFGNKTLKGRVIYNCVDRDFQNPVLSATINRKYITMLCSLKDYKGVKEFVLLASRLRRYTFLLIVNADAAEVQEYFKDMSLPNNLQIKCKQTNVVGYYQESLFVLNLSHPDKWLETFGLTALEAMSLGVPVIVPDAGGIAEIVQQGGFKFNYTQLNEIEITLTNWLEDPKRYQALCNAARENANRYSPEEFNSEFELLFSQLGNNLKDIPVLRIC